MKRALLFFLFIIIGLKQFAQKDSIWSGELKEIAIRPFEPDSVWGSAEWNVADFIFIDNKILLLVYERELRWKCQHEGSKTLYSGAHCVLLDEHGKQCAVSKKINEEVEHFDGLYLHGVFIKARNEHLKVVVENNTIDFYPVSERDFLDYVTPYLDSLGAYVFISTFDQYYPAFEYALLDASNGRQKTLRTIEDGFGMELFRSEYKYLAPRQRMEVNQLALDLKRDKNVIAAYARGFHHSMYFETPYAPVFSAENGIFIFDHYRDSVFEFDVHGELRNSFYINYHKKQRHTKWEKSVVFDEKQRRFHTLYSKGPHFFIHEINMDGSGIGEAKRLFYGYPENVKVFDGRAYYIYRPFESLQNRYLYSEPLLTER